MAIASLWALFAASAVCLETAARPYRTLGPETKPITYSKHQQPIAARRKMSRVAGVQ